VDRLSVAANQVITVVEGKNTGSVGAFDAGALTFFLDLGRRS
jgi:hypothetical protein